MSHLTFLKGASSEVRDAVKHAIKLGWTPVKKARHIMLYGPNRKGLVVVSLTPSERHIYKKILGDIKREMRK